MAPKWPKSTQNEPKCDSPISSIFCSKGSSLPPHLTPPRGPGGRKWPNALPEVQLWIIVSAIQSHFGGEKKIWPVFFHSECTLCLCLCLCRRLVVASGQRWEVFCLHAMSPLEATAAATSHNSAGLVKIAWLHFGSLTFNINLQEIIIGFKVLRWSLSHQTHTSAQAFRLLRL